VHAALGQIDGVHEARPSESSPVRGDAPPSPTHSGASIAGLPFSGCPPFSGLGICCYYCCWWCGMLLLLLLGCLSWVAPQFDEIVPIWCMRHGPDDVHEARPSESSPVRGDAPTSNPTPMLLLPQPRVIGESPHLFDEGP
jgi:hypothetical protein